jgi:hypothetical protein
MIQQRKSKAQESISSPESVELEIARLEKILDVQTAKGNVDDAIVTINQVLTLRLNNIKQIRITRLETMEELNPVIQLYHSLGFLLAEKGDEENAQLAHQEGMRLFRSRKANKRS